MKRVQTESAPAAIGPYSQAIVSGGYLYCSGQIPLIPETMELKTGTIEDEATQVLENLKAVLEAGGSSLDRVVKVTAYIKNMDDFSRINAVYSNFFGDHAPARAVVEVARLPKDVNIEIDCVAEVI